jgi:stage II sporulation protein D
VRYTGEFRAGRRLPRPVTAGIVSIAMAAGAVAVTVGAQPRASAAAEVVTRPASGVWVVDGHGYGHGRGMSQWGAHAAATAGRSAEQILAFYYPNTTRTSIGNPLIRVDIGGLTSLVLRPVAGLRVSWSGGGVTLPAVRGAVKWQVAASGSAMRLRYQTARAWTWWGPALPRSVTVTASHGVLRVIRPDGTGTDLRESVVATRSGSGVEVVNRLHLETYLRGVVPRESPASWPIQSLRAQAIAARTYAYRSIRSPRSSLYDICDSTACQVYGGAGRYSAGGTRLYGEQPTSDTAVASTAGVILTHAGAVAATEYSSSNGGWIATGASYLPAKKDPFTAGDPYASWSVKVNVIALGRKFGLARLDRLTVTGRDGQGAWGGRVTAATLTGIDGAGKPRSVQVTGSKLASALGVRSNYLHLRPA